MPLFQRRACCPCWARRRCQRNDRQQTIDGSAEGWDLLPHGIPNIGPQRLEASGNGLADWASSSRECGRRSCSARKPTRLRLGGLFGNSVQPFVLVIILVLDYTRVFEDEEDCLTRERFPGHTIAQRELAVVVVCSGDDSMLVRLTSALHVAGMESRCCARGIPPRWLC
jgi:hypothetical protein